MTDDLKLKAIEWLLGDDTGISSRTMCAALFDMFPHCNWTDMPHDADDFGRCLRFVRFMPTESKAIMFANLASIPEWRAIAARWDELSDLYDKSKYQEIYEILSGIRKQYRSPRPNEIFL